MADIVPDIRIETVTDKPAKRGPGRPRKDGSSPTTTTVTADVRKAMASLESAYRLVSVGLLMLGLSESAISWEDSVDSLKKTNESALKASPKLAKSIASVGSTGGSITFFLTHGTAVIGLAKTIRAELASRRGTPVPDSSTTEPSFTNA